MPKLVVAIDGVVLKEVPLLKERTTLGRRPYNDIVIDNLAISGEHAVLHKIGSSVYLEDLDSTNGTYVNSRAIRKQVLEHNDLIEVGKYKIRYLQTAEIDEGAHLRMTATAPLHDSRPMPLTEGETVPAALEGGSGAQACIRILSGSAAGHEIVLRKVVTTIGKPGVAVAAVTRRLQGYVVAPVDGSATLNGETLQPRAAALQDGDILELGGTRMQFVLG
ncbi:MULTISPECIES: FHA domain-containing protein [Pseudacidovorax]|jgi:FHA domain|uniref:FHA domain-containing protein n=1 Tax=Pseudacidovorax TaxID=433923 RepID=UPI000347964D|nr:MULTISPECIES: FHA domain-containing protein [Pseudacidovorax]MBO9645709.1 FHA domain-containing protein [Pseudacidovorax sp.]MBP6897563.1 FHA domain-containing protein [Pseudacidovorax sp.]